MTSWAVTQVAKDPSREEEGLGFQAGVNENSFGHVEVPVGHSGGNDKEEIRETDLELRRKVLQEIRICKLCTCG